jgi:MFS family permease
MHVEKKRRAHAGTRVAEEFRAGLSYVARSTPMRSALLLLALVSVMGMPYTVLMPAIASEQLHGGPHTLGFLMTASGMGALAGALYLASRQSVLGLGRAMTIATFAFGAGLMAFSLSRALWLSLLLLPIVGGGMMVETASTNTILQTIVEERMRGRVMSFYAMAFLGTAPIGSLLAGVLADRIGAPMTILLGGIACIAGGTWFAIRLPALRAILRPIYVEKGILPSG